MRRPIQLVALPAMFVGACVYGIAYGQLSVAWVRQFAGTGTYVHAVAAVPDGVYAAGETLEAFPGQTNRGGFDTFLVKYDAHGNQVWARQSGTVYDEYAGGVSAAADGIYLGISIAQPGSSLVRKYDLNGNELWSRSFHAGAHGVTATPDGVYVAGGTAGVLPGQTQTGDFDAFIRKYDPSGNELWTRQFGAACGAPSNTTNAMMVAATNSGLYVAGYSACALRGQSNSGGVDAFLRKYDLNGNELWTREFGSPAEDEAFSVSAGKDGVYVGGRTAGALPGQAHSGAWDAFVRKYDENGNELWTRQFGSPAGGGPAGVSAVPDGGMPGGVLAAWFGGLARFDSNGTAAGGVSSFESLRPNAVDAATGQVYVSGGYLGNDAVLAMLVPVDRTPPAISGMPAAGCTLWPPNHKMVQVGVVTAADALSGLAPGSFRVTGTSNEREDPGNPDILITPNGTGRYAVQLRADRLGSGKGRVYTLTATASDLAGNTAIATATCTVPHSQGK